MKMDKSVELTKRFNPYYPGGHSNLRISSQSKTRLFINRTEGSRMWDVDGNEYVDFLAALGPNILGHRHPEYTKALMEYLGQTSPCVGSGTLYSEDDIAVAEKLHKYVPCAEKIKFSVTGSDAVQVAIRLSRAYTGRPYFIRLAGHYHGWLDNVVGGQVDPNPAGKPFAYQDPNSDPWTDSYNTFGKGPDSNKESFLIPWNNLEILEETLKKYGDEVAMIHMETIVCNHFCLLPRPGYLEKIRELCTRYGIVLSFDEVITGFRLGLGGAQQYFGVTPDLATFGKALAGGLPVSAVMGKADIMNLFGSREKKVLGPGTFNGWGMGMRAALATLSILEKDNGAVYKEMARLQKRLTDGLMATSKKHGLPLRIQGAPGVFYTLFGVSGEAPLYTEEDLSAMNKPMSAYFWSRLQEEGVIFLGDGRWYMSAAHTDKDIDLVLSAADRIMAEMKSK